MDNGFTQVRRIVLDRRLNAIAMSRTNNAATQVYYRDVVYQSNYVDAGYPSMSQFKGERAFLNDLTPYEQLAWALGGELTATDKNPPPITQETFNASKAWETRAFTGSTYQQAEDAFNDYAMEYEFGDGLPLVVPTADRVDAMLAATTRAADEVLGMMKMRGGIITIEKIAINAVMAGAKPEYLPVIIAAMEAYATGWEFDKMWYHPMTSGGAFNLSMILSGPISEEIGVDVDTGFMGSGHHANNTIGRAVRLCIRNIGQNYTPFVDTQNRYGRWNDHTLTFIVENDAALPAGWETHSEMMGYPAGSSTLTLNGFVGGFIWMHVEADGWNVPDLLGSMRGQIGTGNTMSQSKVLLIPPGFAESLAYEGFTETYNDVVYNTSFNSKDALLTFFATRSINPTPRTVGINDVWNFTGVIARSASIYANTHIIVAGNDPGNGIALNNIMYGVNLCYTTQLITGATLTTAGQGATAPSTPENFEVIVGEASGVATLKWDAPLSDGGSAITGYQYNIVHGGNQQTAPWTAVPGGAAAREIRLTGLNDGQQYFFKVRAINGVVNSAEMVSNAISARAAGRGAWALTEDVRTRPSTSITFPGFSEVQIRYWTNGSWKTLGGNYNWYTDGALFDIPAADYPANGIATIQVLFQEASPTGHYYTFSDVVLGPNLTLAVPIATVTVNTASAGRLALVDGDWVYHYEAVAAGEQTIYRVFDNGKRFTVRFQPTGGAVASTFAFAGDTVSFP